MLNTQGKVISRFTITDYPVVVSQEKTLGVYDLYLLSCGNYHVVKFDGKTYPGNPSLLPKLSAIPGDGLPRVLDFTNDKYPWLRF